MLSVDLIARLRSERAQKNTKHPFGRTLFDRVSGLVRQYALGEDFLRQLEDFSRRSAREGLKFDRGKTKELFEPPLFSLSTEDEYRVTKAIMVKVSNPYLHFVNSPDEILLCGPLYSRTPTLGPDKLARCHFATLLLDEPAKEGPGDLQGPNLNLGREQ
jgi:hypothetical protein